MMVLMGLRSRWWVLAVVEVVVVGFGWVENEVGGFWLGLRSGWVGGGFCGSI